jgi:hypothetical protein
VIGDAADKAATEIGGKLRLALFFGCFELLLPDQNLTKRREKYACDDLPICKNFLRVFVKP